MREPEHLAASRGVPRQRRAGHTADTVKSPDPVSPSPDNPFVGPRAFDTGETLFGRDRQRVALLDLLISARIVLLYSPSGAGKTSLINAALIPDLREERFTVRRVPRVSQ